MATVAIVGAGDIGGATAQALASCDRVHRVWLVDAAAGAAAGKALDLQQAGAIAGHHARLDGTSDETRLIGCAVCVVADRFGVSTGERCSAGPQNGDSQNGEWQTGEWQGDEGLSMLGRITRYLGDAPIVFAGASHAGLLSRLAGETPIRRERLIGSSAEALVSAITAIVAMEASCSPPEVMLAVLGTPPDGFVVPWSEASIGGYGMQRVLSQVQLARIEARVARLWPPGPYALGAAAASVTDAILANSRRSFSIITQLHGEFGVKRRPGALPARLSAGGIAQVRVPELGTREQVRLQTALGG
jgi:malate dehydrogenase